MGKELALQIYGILGEIGFNHPLHSPVTHLPIGVVVAAFIFILLALIVKKNSLRQSALYCAILAFLFLFPAVLTGWIDFQYNWGGTMVRLIKIKMVLSAVLAGLLLLAMVLHFFRVGTGKLALIYLLCLLSVTALGYCGGELIYGG